MLVLSFTSTLVEVSQRKRSGNWKLPLGKNWPHAGRHLSRRSICPHPSRVIDQCDIVRLIWQLRKFSQVGGGSESMVRPTFAPVEIVRDTGNHDDEFCRGISIDGWYAMRRLMKRTMLTFYVIFIVK